MNAALFLCLAAMPFSTLVIASAPSGAGGDQSSGALTAKKASPFYCNVHALNREERKRHFDELGPKLRSLRKSVRELENGYAFEFPGNDEVYQLVSEWAIQERRCCPFFDISLRLEPEGGPLWLILTGRPGTKDFIKVDGAAWIKR
jgi:hypothetical protein